MKALRQIRIFGLDFRRERAPGEDTRVLELFRNRAELKKAYGQLQDETFRLKDLIKQQEAATQRAQEMLSALEARLGVPESAYAALVFYQLRHLWQSGRELLTQFVSDLARQQEERERRVHLAQHNRQQFARRADADEQLRAAQALHLEAGAQLAALESARAALGRWWHYFRRRALAQRIASARAGLAAATRSLDEAQESVAAVARESPAEFAGLSLTARRAINLAAIAYAEALCLRLIELDEPLVKLAREATAAREADQSYGSAQQCALLMGQIAHAHTLLGGRAGLTDQIRARSERLKGLVRYRSPTDSAPVVESLAFSEADGLAVGALAVDTAPLPNVLAEDTWDLFRVLLR